MSVEIELKLRVIDKKVAEVEQYLNKSSVKRAGMHHYMTTYFDSPQWLLHKKLYSLRIREEDGQFTQTLKKGKSVQGDVQERSEWKWPLFEHKLDFSLIEALTLDKPCSFEDLVPLFVTDFQRQDWLFSLSNDTEVMCSLDQGKILAGQQSEIIAEVELELVRGDVATLSDLSSQLINDLPLVIDPRSKAARGFDLLGN